MMALDYSGSFTAAAVQAEPVWLDLAGTVDKTVALIEEAAQGGADLVAFPETWIPGYPLFIWLDSVPWQAQFVVPYAMNSMEVDGPEMERLKEAARINSIAVVVGFSERAQGSLYMSQAIIDRDGSLVVSRRKLKPTHAERTVFGDGDGSDVVVCDTSLGRVGALCCWEHIQPLTKYAMYAQHEQVHVASWPSFCLPEEAYAFGAEVNTSASQLYAVEGQTFVVASSFVVGEAAYAAFCQSDAHKQILQLGGGHSRIFAPDGRPLAAPIPPHEEGIIYAQIDLPYILMAKNAADPVGHYSRPDVFQLSHDVTPRLRVNRPSAQAPLSAIPFAGPDSPTPTVSEAAEQTA